MKQFTEEEIYLDHPHKGFFRRLLESIRNTGIVVLVGYGCYYSYLNRETLLDNVGSLLEENGKISGSPKEIEQAKNDPLTKAVEEVKKEIAKRAVSVPVVKKMIMDKSSKYGVNPMLILAIAEVESNFQSDAINPNVHQLPELRRIIKIFPKKWGITPQNIAMLCMATGVMQLMPTTALDVAKRHNIPLPVPEMLFDPNINIELGIIYVAEALEDGGGSLDYLSRKYYGNGKSQEMIEARISWRNKVEAIVNRNIYSVDKKAPGWEHKRQKEEALYGSLEVKEIAAVEPEKKIKKVVRKQF